MTLIELKNKLVSEKFEKKRDALMVSLFFFHILSKKKLEPWFQNHKGGEDVQTTQKTDQRSEEITFR